MFVGFCVSASDQPPRGIPVGIHPKRISVIRCILLPELSRQIPWRNYSEPRINHVPSVSAITRRRSTKRFFGFVIFARDLTIGLRESFLYSIINLRSANLTRSDNEMKAQRLRRSSLPPYKIFVPFYTKKLKLTPLTADELYMYTLKTADKVWYRVCTNASRTRVTTYYNAGYYIPARLRARYYGNADPRNYTLGTSRGSVNILIDRGYPTWRLYLLIPPLDRSTKSPLDPSRYGYTEGSSEPRLCVVGARDPFFLSAESRDR